MLIFFFGKQIKYEIGSLQIDALPSLPFFRVKVEQFSFHVTPYFNSPRLAVTII